MRQGYTQQLTRSFHLLALFVFPCFFAETAYKVWWYYVSADKVPWLGNPIVSDVVACFAELSSWLYRSSIFFLTCVLFRLICYLQNLRLQVSVLYFFGIHTWEFLYFAYVLWVLGVHSGYIHAIGNKQIRSRLKF